MLRDVFTNLLLWARHFTRRELYELPIKHSGFLQHALSVGEPQKTIPGGVGGSPQQCRLLESLLPTMEAFLQRDLSLEMGSVKFLQGEPLVKGTFRRGTRSER